MSDNRVNAMDLRPYIAKRTPVENQRGMFGLEDSERYITPDGTMLILGNISAVTIHRLSSEDRAFVGIKQIDSLIYTVAGEDEQYVLKDCLLNNIYPYDFANVVAEFEKLSAAVCKNYAVEYERDFGRPHIPTQIHITDIPPILQ